jgi:hypothetical protein
MKKTLTTHEVAEILSNNKDNGFSYKGAYAVAEYLENLEMDLSQEWDLDPVAIRSDFSEYKSLIEANEDLKVLNFDLEDFEDLDEDEILEKKEELIRDYFFSNTQLIEFEEGIILGQH